MTYTRKTKDFKIPSISFLFDLEIFPDINSMKKEIAIQIAIH